MSKTLPELHAGTAAEVGRFSVCRLLPRRTLRTVGAWCFADEMGPEEVTETAGIDVGPHPHTGLQTVTWLLNGQVLHKDSLGSEQLIRPGQLNLMTAGRGVVHAEEAVSGYRGQLHGLQLWVAQSNESRGGDPAFQHISELAGVELPTGEARLLAGEWLGVNARTGFQPGLFGAHLSLHSGANEVPLDPSFEYAAVVVSGEISLNGVSCTPGNLAYLTPGQTEAEIASGNGAELLLLGGTPLTERLFMWWNFVARSAAEVDEFYRDWTQGAERFGEVNSDLSRIAAPLPPWQAMRVSSETS